MSASPRSQSPISASRTTRPTGKSCCPGSFSQASCGRPSAIVGVRLLGVRDGCCVRDSAGLRAAPRCRLSSHEPGLWPDNASETWTCATSHCTTPTGSPIPQPSQSRRGSAADQTQTVQMTKSGVGRTTSSQPLFCAPGRIRTSVYSLGTRWSEPVFDLFRHGEGDPSGTLIPKPSQNCGSLAVSGGKLIGGG